MTFGLQMYQAPRVTSYTDALKVLQRAMERRPRTVAVNGDNCYPIPGKENNRDVSVRKTPKGIAFRYWHTDVITWHPGGSYTYDNWTSRSTCTFFNQFCPVGTYLTRDGAVLVIEGKAYPVVSLITVRDGEVVGGGLGQFAREKVNRKRAKAVLAQTRYAEYRDWYKVMKPLLGETRQPLFDPVDALEDESSWPMMAACRMNDGHPDTVRKAIYAHNHAEAYDTVTAETIPTEEAHNSKWRVE